MQPGGVVLNGRSIDLRNIETPTYILGTEKDHIAQWRSTYTAVLLQRGPVRFVLAGSGHINGVINPPWQEKYYFYVNDNIAQTADLWFADARKETGSWWSDWHAWQQRLAGDRVCARHIDPDAAIEPAPGRYVRRRIVQGTAVAPDESGGAFGVGGGR
jgi:polyhydroxyalkanoate synthase